MSLPPALPPKSGWRCLTPPWLTYPMKADEPASTGAAEISLFHQFVGGKSGGGPGTLASRRGAIWTVSTAAASGGQIAEAGAPVASRAAAAIDAFTPKSLVMVSAEIMEFQRFRDT